MTPQEIHEASVQYAESLHAVPQAKQDLISAFVAGYDCGHTDCVMTICKNQECAKDIKTGSIEYALFHHACAYIQGLENGEEFHRHVRRMIEQEQEHEKGERDEVEQARLAIKDSAAEQAQLSLF